MAATRRKPPRKVTQPSLERAALAYLERFAASTESLRRVLLRKIERSARVHDIDRAEASAWVEALIERYLRSGLLDDRAYAEARTASLRRQGRSARAIADRLAQKGVGRKAIADALAPTRIERDELDAAARLARRRRIGPFRPEAERREHRERDLATLGRAGFAFETARKVVLAESSEALDALIAERG
ncbi:MAG: RecX family transcriptional regulator [Alphaproteobacteria bacterium]|nr:RecX family transcriptional regulator [Alphaproteobacteria bacterium]